ncbi:MAG: insulinase family protein [Candidatus Marinimicrobia bacterium]|nr:insulinase family protein [Candidatus Neomarinimicrobiota bacterium]
MKSRWVKDLAPVMALLVISACGQQERAAETTTGFIVEGLEVIFLQTPDQPLVAFGFYLKGGGNYVGANQSGIEVLLLETALRGTETRSHKSLVRRLTGLNTHFDVTSSDDFTGLRGLTPKANFAAAWELFADILMRPRLEPADIEKVRRRMLAQMTMFGEYPAEVALDMAVGDYYADHPYRYIRTGGAKSIAALTRNDLIQFYRADFTKNRSLLAVVGDLTIEEVTRLARKLARKLPQGPDLLLPGLTFDAGDGGAAVKRQSLPTHFLTGLFSAPRPGHAEYPAFTVALELFRQRLVTQLQSRRALTDRVVTREGDLVANYGSISFTTTELVAAVSVVRNTLADLMSGEITEPEVKAAMQQRLIQYMMQAGSVEGKLDRMAQWGIVAEDWRQAEQFPAEVAKVTADEVRAMVRKYIRRIHWGGIGPSRRLKAGLFKAR